MKKTSSRIEKSSSSTSSINKSPGSKIQSSTRQSSQVSSFQSTRRTSQYGTSKNNQKDEQPPAQELFRILQNYAKSGKVQGIPATVPPNVWCNKKPRIALKDKIFKLCYQTEKTVSREPRVLDLQQPVYCFGDIHGSFQDLTTFSNTFWKEGPAEARSNFLFLGDFVDRGFNSVEVILYLFCLKVLSPTHFWLVRGNHETRQLAELKQEGATLKDELNYKFDADLGAKIFECCHRVFDRMPIAAIIDKSIFCCHGGIPGSVTDINSLRSVSCPLTNPEVQAPPAWELLWNDPITGNEQHIKRNEINLWRTKFRGFLKNLKRGTGYFFTEEALDSFLKANKLTKMIRAHESEDDGFRMFMHNKGLTVFSASNYCNKNNRSACALVNNNKVTIYKFNSKK